MALIRLQDKTPAVYTEESRDFQLLCRLYDCVVNGVKYDIDSMQDITNTEYCRSNILQLLQTKVGFFTSKYIDDDKLRCILTAFPIMVKHKGSLQAIKEAINTYLKANNIVTDVTVWYITDSTSTKTDTIGIEEEGQHYVELTSTPKRIKSVKIIGTLETYVLDPTLYSIDDEDDKKLNIDESVELLEGDEVAVTYAYSINTAHGIEYNKDHTIVIGLGTEISDTTILEEIFRYILPTGFGYYFYFFSSIDAVTKFTAKNHAVLLYASDNINAQLRMSDNFFVEPSDYHESMDEVINRNINAIGSMELASDDSYVEAGMYLGILSTFPTATYAEHTLMSIVEDKELHTYIAKSDSTWLKLNYLGYIAKLPTKKNSAEGDVYYSAKDKCYAAFIDGSWSFKDNALAVAAQIKITEEE